MTNQPEIFTAIDTHTGRVIGTADTTAGAQEVADRAKPTGRVTVRGEYTSDGTNWGLGRGRVVYERDARGHWYALL